MPTFRLPTTLKCTSATLRRWLKTPGDPVAPGDPLVELELEDSTAIVESPLTGTLITAVPAGTSVKPGAELGTIEPTHKTESAPMKTASGTVTPILMPQAGNTMEEGTILKWRVKVGDPIAIGQILYDVETDKATVEVEATEAGRLARIVAAEGSVVPVKQAVAYLAGSDEDVDAFLSGNKIEAASHATHETASEAPSVAVSVPVAQRAAGERVKASPAARKLAAEKGVDLAGLNGSGPEGRVLSTDVAGAQPAAKAPALPGGMVRRAMSKMRKAIAVNLQTSKQTVPHFYVKVTINADPLFSFYRARKIETGCTLNDVILLAVGKTVGEFAAFRSRVEGSDIVELPNANIGVAVSIDDGLVVPVVTGVEVMTLGQLATETKRVVESARKGKIENMGKGVFTISNMGMLGVEEFSAIINPPESGILAISAVRESVIVKDGAMKAGRVMTMTLSVDHRVVDGAVAAVFMAKLRERLEAPEAM